MGDRVTYAFWGLGIISAAVGALGLAPERFDLVGWLLAGLFFTGGWINQSPKGGTLGAALYAAACNGYLLSRKIEGSGDSACNITDTVNCDLVNSSPASEMFGVPITLFGLAFYLGLFLAGLGAKRPRFFQVSGLFAIVTLIYSAYLGWESKQLDAVCVVCITIYACNGLLLWAALAGLKEQGQKLFAELGSALSSATFLTVSAAFVMITVMGTAFYQDATKDELTAVLERPDPTPGRKVKPDSTPEELPSDVLSQLYHQTRGEVTLDGSEHVYGDPNAPYLLVEWADYGCPHCAMASKELKSLVKERPEIQVQFKVFPLTAACNPALERDTGSERCQAAMAAECAGEQGKFYEMNGLIFTNQTYLSDSDLAFMAKEVGLDVGAWEQCMGSEAVREGVIADAIAGAKAGVLGTPAMFLKGTHDDQFIELTRGAASALYLVEAHMDGVPLPPPGEPPPPPM